MRCERGVDLGDQLALAVAGAQLDRAVGLRGGAVGEVGMILVLVLEMLQRLLGLLEDVLPPVEQLLAEILPLALVHERLFVGRPIVLVLSRLACPFLPPTCRSVLLVRRHGFPALNRRLPSPPARAASLYSGRRDMDNNGIMTPGRRGATRPAAGTGGNCGRDSGPAQRAGHLGDFDLDPQLDLGQHAVEARRRRSRP